jgi:DNA-binding NarL/FixJ family response regulator
MKAGTGSMQSIPLTHPTEARIIIVDPHPLVREGLRMSLERKHNVEVVAEAGDGMAGLYAAAKFPEAILLTNAHLPDTSVVDLVRRFQSEARQGTGVVICHLPQNPSLIRQFIENCAMAFIGQNAGSREYAAAIEAVLAGGIFMSSNLLDCLLLDRDAGRYRANPYKLTDREVEVLNCLAKGFSNKEVANEFDLSVRTVEAHRFSIRQKTGANVLSELVRISRSIESDNSGPEIVSMPRPFMKEPPSLLEMGGMKPVRNMKESSGPSASGFLQEKRDA